MTDRENRIDRFRGDALANAELRNELRAVIWNRDDIGALAKKHGQAIGATALVGTGLDHPVTNRLG